MDKSLGTVFHNIMIIMMMIDDAANTPVWPIWTLGALFRDARCTPTLFGSTTSQRRVPIVVDKVI
jgi:hypothetical protein